MTAGISRSLRPKLPSTSFFRSRGSSLSDVTERLEARLGRIPFSGRYHRMPCQIEDDYELADVVLGSGYTGTVRLATSRSNTQQRYAVKTLSLSAITRDRLEQLRSEVENLLSMDHPHIVRLHDVYESRRQLHLVMECLDGGELFDRVSERGHLPEEDATDVVWQILLALHYLHSHGVVHRDLKLENFLFDQQGSKLLKLIDFGFSKRCDAFAEVEGSLGTIAYVAPEVLKQRYTSQCDLWSLGVINFILLCGHMPFSGPDSMMIRNIAAGEYTLKPRQWRGISEEACSFTKSLLHVDPRTRLTATAALNHPWLAQRRQAAACEVDVGVVQALQRFSALPKFRRCCMEMIAWSLSSDERAQVYDHFVSLDTTRKGTITLAELRKALRGRCTSEAEIQGVFTALDSNGDREIHYSDFLAAMVSVKITLHDELLAAAFDRFDADGSGCITNDDLREVLGETFEGEAVEALLREADHNGDDRVSYPEFAAYVRGAPLSPEDLLSENPQEAYEVTGKLSRSASLKCMMKSLSTLLCVGPSPNPH